jgi:dipeptidyl aminopeptidase/acylaminoacyl peptidase
MNKIRSLISTLVGVLALAALAVGLSWLVGPRGPLPGQQVLPPPTPTEESTHRSPLPTPTPIVSVPETPPVPGKAATLWDGNIWLVEHGREPEALTDFGDLSAIFGWNWDGTKLLFGRGRKQHEWEFVSDTTELWVIELASGDVKQLTTGSNVHTAVWSPVEDGLAYCEQDAGLKVITFEGEILYEMPKGLCIRSTWSPDGTALATAIYFGEDPRPYDELENEMLVVLDLSDDTITVLTDEGSPYAPVWSTDGRHILFQRMFVTMASGETPWYLADVVTGDVTRLDNAPPLAGVDPIRSPRGDFIVVGIGEGFYVLDFAGNTLFTARGRGLVWAPDGQTVVCRDEANQLQAISLPLEVRSSRIGGNLPAPVLYDYLRWKFFW